MWSVLQHLEKCLEKEKDEIKVGNYDNVAHLAISWNANKNALL